MKKTALLYKGKKAPITFSLPWLQEPISFGKSNVAEAIETDAIRLCSEFPKTFEEFKGIVPEGNINVQDAETSSLLSPSQEVHVTHEAIPFERQGEHFLCPYCDKQYKEDHGKWEARMLEHVAEEHPAELEKHIVDEGI